MTDVGGIINKLTSPDCTHSTRMAKSGLAQQGQGEGWDI